MLCFMAPYTIKLFQQMIPSIINFFKSIKQLINKGTPEPDKVITKNEDDDSDKDEPIF